jgi:hypothetical protein
MAYHPDEERSGDQLKKKFNKLAKTKMGTGDPNMPADVREARFAALSSRSQRELQVQKKNVLR